MGCDPEVCVPLADGSTFHLSAYVRSREAITEEFSRRMPGMQQFVADWLRAHEPVISGTSVPSPPRATCCKRQKASRGGRSSRGRRGGGTCVSPTSSTMASSSLSPPQCRRRGWQPASDCSLQ